MRMATFYRPRHFHLERPTWRFGSCHWWSSKKEGDLDVYTYNSVVVSDINSIIFTPIPGEMIQFDEHIFQMGWNHQLDKSAQWCIFTYTFTCVYVYLYSRTLDLCFFLLNAFYTLGRSRYNFWCTWCFGFSKSTLASQRLLSASFASWVGTDFHDFQFSYIMDSGIIYPYTNLP